MLCSLWRNNIGDKGAAALAAILKETQISDLKCAATLSVFAFVSAPVDTLALLHIPALPLVCSLGWNSIGAEGASALAAILKETQITTLACAPAPYCSIQCQRPLTAASIRPYPHARSLRGNALGPGGAAALAEGLKGNLTLQVLE